MSIKGGERKLAVVAGELPTPRLLAMFETLKSTFDVTIFVLSTDAALELHGTGLKLRVFEDIAEMPGYMRGLEDELQGMDLIIGFETSRLSSFQAVRAARKHGVPFIAVVTEHRPYFYLKQPNIRAIQFDICAKAARLLALSQAAAQGLELDGLDPGKIVVTTPVINVKKFSQSAEARQRFRNYVGIGLAEILVLFPHPLEPHTRPSDLLHAVNALRQLASQPNILASAGRLRLLFAGRGSLAKSLQYEAFDLGLGRQSMFLAQDFEPFLPDLLAASDFLVMPTGSEDTRHEPYPLLMLEAMAAGVVPIVPSGSVAAELAGESGIVQTAEGRGGLLGALRTALKAPSELDDAKLCARNFAVRQYGLESTGAAAMEREVMAALEQFPTTRATGRDLTHQAGLDLIRGQRADALVKAEEALLIGDLDATTRAEALGIRGDAGYSGGDVTSALLSYEAGFKLDERNLRCLRGLGYVAWQGHANDEALSYFKKALAIREDDPETAVGIGLIYRRLGLIDDAIYWLERAATEHQHRGALSALSHAVAQLDSPEHAITILERVLEATGDSHVLLVTLGQFYLREGRTSEGEALMSRAMSLGGGSGTQAS